MKKPRGLKDLVEEATQLAPCKFKKKKMRKDEAGSSKAKAHERTPSLVKQRKGMDKVNMGSPLKTLVAP